MESLKENQFSTKNSFSFLFVWIVTRGGDFGTVCDVEDVDQPEMPPPDALATSCAWGGLGEVNMKKVNMFAVSFFFFFIHFLIVAFLIAHSWFFFQSGGVVNQLNWMVWIIFFSFGETYYLQTKNRLLGSYLPLDRDDPPSRPCETNCYIGHKWW